MSVQDELFATSVGPYAHLVSDLGVHRDIYVDPAVFEAELRRIFGRVWVYVGHESEVPRAGDFKTSWIGRQPVIVSRDQHGRLHVLYNRCTHRAATVCQERGGHTDPNAGVGRECHSNRRDRHRQEHATALRVRLQLRAKDRPPVELDVTPGQRQQLAPACPAFEGRDNQPLQPETGTM